MFRAEENKARRQGYWFRLGKIERAFFSLATRLPTQFRSFDLLKAMVAVLKKLKEFGGESYGQLRRGLLLAWSFSEASVRWGNESAREWRNDRNYILFLGRTHRKLGWSPSP